VNVTFVAAKLPVPQEQDVVVPNLQGQTPAQVIETLQALRLSLQKAGAGTVSPQAKAVNQNPAAGTKVKANSSVAVLFAEAKVEPKKVAVPDLRGKPVAEAKRLLANVGLAGEFRDAQMNKVFSDANLAGLVKEQKQKPGEQVPIGSTINLTFEFFR
jgi:serine/threonine-protein kinase